MYPLLELSDKNIIKTLKIFQIFNLGLFLIFLITLMVIKLLKYIPKSCPGPKDSKSVSHMKIEWQKHHQDPQNSPNIHFWDVHELPDDKDDDEITLNLVLSNAQV